MADFLAMVAARRAKAAEPATTPNPIPAPPVPALVVVPSPPVPAIKPANPFLAKLAALKAIKEGSSEAAAKETLGLVNLPRTTLATSIDEVYGIPRVFSAGNPLNDKQMLGCAYAKEGKSFVLTGAAGTGKTTGQAGVVQMLDESGAFGVHDFKYIGDAPSIAIVAFTKVAVRNIAKAIKKNPSIAHYSEHCMTIHALLEYEPVVEDREDENGVGYEVRVFRPQRTKYNPLQITHLIVEEASMVGMDLWSNLYEALLPGVQIIFLGDINQLQPVFGKPVLGYALSQLPVIELTEVYRQALDNPIIANAHRVLKGGAIESSTDGRVAVVTGKHKYKIGQEETARGLLGLFKKLFESGNYNPDTDVILSPWNKKALGTQNMNEGIATFLGAARQALVYEVKTGFTSIFLAVGDKVLVDKRMGRITAIAPNPKYVGAETRTPGAWTRSGVPIVGGLTDSLSLEELANATVGIDYENFSLADIEASEEAATRAASHIVSVYWDDLLTEEGVVLPGTPTEQLSTAGAFRYEKFQFGYCLTVHKAQGSEWEKVFLILHYDHAVSLSRELIYTALTRARESFTVLAKEDLLATACVRACIKGDNLAAKIAYFTDGLCDAEEVLLIPPASVAV